MILVYELLRNFGRGVTLRADTGKVPRGRRADGVWRVIKREKS